MCSASGPGVDIRLRPAGIFAIEENQRLRKTAAAAYPAGEIMSQRICSNGSCFTAGRTGVGNLTANCAGCRSQHRFLAPSMSAAILGPGSCIIMIQITVIRQCQVTCLGAAVIKNHIIHAIRKIVGINLILIDLHGFSRPCNKSGITVRPVINIDR